MVGVHIVDYDRDWPDRAAEVSLSIKNVLNPWIFRIEHIGSTSIFKMAAKDVIDLQVSVEELSSVTTTFDARLRVLGFQLSPHEYDHIAAGLADVKENWAKRLWTRRNHPEGDVNLHIRRVGSSNERLALLFRDWFRSHPEAVESYGAFKRSLSVLTLNVDSYSDVKDPVVDLVICVAERWAKEVNWCP